MQGLIISCDWGTTHFRLRAVTVDPFAVVGEFCSAEGVAALAGQPEDADRAERYRAVLTAALGRLSGQLDERLAGAPVLISGMASSSIGWQELPYARLPLPLDGSRLEWRELPPVESDSGSHPVVLISGARADADVMRGEETELVGLFTLPETAGLADSVIVIKPGTHTKHVRVENKRIVGFQTFMTGELYDVLSRHSILQHSLADSIGGAPESTDAALRAGVRHGREHPLSAALFQVRTRQLLDDESGASNRAFLSGVLLGSELASLLADRVADVPLVLSATEPLRSHYLAGFEELGLCERLTVIQPADVELLSARGQAALWQSLRKELP